MNQYRVGLTMSVVDRWSPTMHAQSRLLNRLHKQVQTLNQAASCLGGLGPRGGGTTIGGNPRIRLAREEARLAVIKAQTEAKTDAIRAKSSAKAEVERQKEQRANLATIRFKGETANIQRAADRVHEAALKRETTLQKTADANHETALKRQESVIKAADNAQRAADQRHEAGLERQNTLRAAGDRRALIDNERLQQAQMRTLIMGQRMAKATAPNLTADQEWVAHQQGRWSSFSDAGNRIATGRAMMGSGINVLKEITAFGHDEAMTRYMHERTGFEQMNLGASQNRLAMAAAERVRHEVRGIDMAGAIDVIKDLVNVTGSVQKATNPELVKQFAQFKVANKAAYGLTDNQALNAIKAAELLTPNTRGMTAAQQERAVLVRLGLVHQAMAGTSNRVGPNEILNFAKTAQSARMGLTSEGLVKLVPIMQEMSGNRTGTALMSLMQNLANGRATTRSVVQMQQLGLLNKTVDGKAALMYDKNGRVKGMAPGALKGDTLLRQDPVAWAERYIMPLTKGKDATQVDRLINSILGNRTAASLMMTMLMQNGRIHKDAAIISNSRGIEATDAAQRTNYLRQEANYEASLNTLCVKAGTIMLPTLTRFVDGLSQGLDMLNDAIDQHPTIAKVSLLSIGIGAVGTSAAGAVIALSGIKDALKGLAAMRAVSAVGGAAYTAGTVAADIGGMAAGGAGTRAFGSSLGGTIAGNAMTALRAGMTSGIPLTMGGLVSAGVVATAGLTLGVAIGNTIRQGILSTDWGQALEDRLENGIAYAMRAWPGFEDNAPSPNATLPGGLPASGLRGGRAALPGHMRTTPRPVATPRSGKTRWDARGPSVQDLINEAQGGNVDAPTSTSFVERYNPPNAIARDIVDRAAGAQQAGTPPGGGNVHTTLQVIVPAPGSAPTLPEPQLRKAAKEAGRLTEKSYYDYLTTGARPTQTVPGPLR